MPTLVVLHGRVRGIEGEHRVAFVATDLGGGYGDRLERIGDLTRRGDSHLGHTLAPNRGRLEVKLAHPLAQMFVDAVAEAWRGARSAFVRIGVRR